jgi:hypothetical protein
MDVTCSQVEFTARSAPSVCFSTFQNHGKMEWIMKELELVDLGDAMAETKCTTPWGQIFDFIYGGSRFSC